jgi:hypothetical protein
MKPKAHAEVKLLCANMLGSEANVDILQSAATIFMLS